MKLSSIPNNTPLKANTCSKTTTKTVQTLNKHLSSGFLASLYLSHFLRDVIFPNGVSLTFRQITISKKKKKISRKIVQWRPLIRKVQVLKKLYQESFPRSFRNSLVILFSHYSFEQLPLQFHNDNCFRSSCSKVFCKKGLLRNYVKFTGKHLYQSLFFNKVTGLKPATLSKQRLKKTYFLVKMKNIFVLTMDCEKRNKENKKF